MDIIIHIDRFGNPDRVMEYSPKNIARLINESKLIVYEDIYDEDMDSWFVLDGHTGIGNGYIYKLRVE